MCDTYDYRLFNNITRNPHYFLHQLLPAAENYNLRACKHNRTLPQLTTRLFDSNFIYRALYFDILLTFCGLCFYIVVLRSVNILLNKRMCTCMCWHKRHGVAYVSIKLTFNWQQRSTKLPPIGIITTYHNDNYSRRENDQQTLAT